jgi:intracellular multiplication protein IcmP
MAGAPQQQQNSDNSLAMLWGVLLTFGLVGLFWFFFHDWIAARALQLRMLEARLLALFSPQMQALVAHLETLEPHQLSVADLAAVSTLVGKYLRFPISVILLVFAVLIYLGRATLQFKRYYDMNALAKLEQQNWAQITPVVPLDLVNTAIDSGPWAMALTPFEFAQKYNLYASERPASSTSEALTMVHHHYLRLKIKREEARRVFSVQLGAPWKNVAVLSMPAKALFAICAARAARDRLAADQLLEQIARSAGGNFDRKAEQAEAHLNFSGTEALFTKHKDHPLVREIINKHTYVLGVMASMLVLSRREGVFASADFLWLKPCDRALWFMLNCMGRKTAYVEVAGPFAHWIAECAVGRKLSVPMIETAVDALELALSEVRLLHDDS